MLDLHSFNVPSRLEIEAAFKVRIRQSVRQNCAMASVAYHMLSSTANRYEQKCGLDEFVITKCDHFVLAACGHTRALASQIKSREDLLKDKDERGRTLLYIASRSGFYDKCLKGMAPSYFSRYFKLKRHNVHDYDTRKKNKIVIDRVKLESTKRAFFYKGADIFNDCI